MSEFKIYQNVEIISKDAVSGKILKISKIHNEIVNSGLERVAKLLGGISSQYFNSIAIGLDNTGVQNTDIELGNEVLRAEATITYISDYQIKFTKNFQVGSGISHTIVESGVFDQSTMSGSTMLDRFVFSAHTLDINNDLEVRVTITVDRS